MRYTFEKFKDFILIFLGMHMPTKITVNIILISAKKVGIKNNFNKLKNFEDF
jgi:hypothetical protein